MYGFCEKGVPSVENTDFSEDNKYVSVDTLTHNFLEE